MKIFLTSVEVSNFLCEEILVSIREIERFKNQVKKLKNNKEYLTSNISSDILNSNGIFYGQFMRLTFYLSSIY